MGHQIRAATAADVQYVQIRTEAGSDQVCGGGMETVVDLSCGAGPL
ncbi:MAG: hypothetical protein AVDCRST_MAG75-2643 [uncultured Propionibacteriaceae bacterium]|uniref:Uncharacterized protein n=1 Tax=uncultured Propionibacteriaceae bacterium TaxID=257457 RepID=A0A6J4PD40_9ACTN|nr:MAG: hypothetical protein AVDCRST_MAG75-2643 [uncultured Propionibacteriaceae bacterium]